MTEVDQEPTLQFGDSPGVLTGMWFPESLPLCARSRPSLRRLRGSVKQPQPHTVLGSDLCDRSFLISVSQDFRKGMTECVRMSEATVQEGWGWGGWGGCWGSWGGCWGIWELAMLSLRVVSGLLRVVSSCGLVWASS